MASFNEVRLLAEDTVAFTVDAVELLPFNVNEKVSQQ
jgi:hypothetical protein